MEDIRRTGGKLESLPFQAPSSSIVSKLKFTRVTFSSSFCGWRRNWSPRWEDWWKRRSRADKGPFR